ncbi:MAG: 6-phosphofructokinase [Halanaerobiaceae bacterium]
MEKIALLTSGGDAPGMNAAIRAVVRSALYEDIEVLGVKRGYYGLMHGDFEKMDRSSVADIIHRGGTILLSARCDEFKTTEGKQKALENMKKQGVDGLIVIGGDGTLRGAQEINEELFIPTIGIPGTIDNDLGGTDYTIGFDTAMNTILDAVNNIRDTATSHERTFVVETMGRKTGVLTLMSGLAGGADSILIPEIDFDVENVCDKIEDGYAKGKLHSIVFVAEGIGESFKTNRDVNESKAFALGEVIKERTEMDVRVIILGHLQRGGRPTAKDRIIASQMGAKAVKLLQEGEKDKMVSFRDNEITTCSTEEAIHGKREIDREIYDLAYILSL